MMMTFLSDETGATAIEYAFIAAMIAVVIVATLALMGGSLTERFQAVTDSFP